MENKLNEITVQYSRPRNQVQKYISTSKNAYEVLKSVYKETESQIDLKESFFVLLLSRSNEVLGYHLLSSGGIHGTIADIKLTFSMALKCVASSIIIAHNHPSGNLKPSESDIVLTKKFKQAGEILDCKVLDHLILSSEGYYSFCDQGQI